MVRYDRRKLYPLDDEHVSIVIAFVMRSFVLKVICQLQQLQILYYHGNAVSDLKEVDTLGRIKTLIKLSLHGNPIDQNIGVRSYTFVLFIRSKLCLVLYKST